MSRQFRPPQPVVWINGWPAMGKQTVAQCLAQILGCDRAVLIDDREFTDQLHLPQDAQLGRNVQLNQSHRKRAQSISVGVDSLINSNGSSSYTIEDMEKKNLETELRQKQEACFHKYLQDPADPKCTTDQAALNRIVIFTDCRADDAEGAEGAQRYATAAARAGRPFVPVYVECQTDEHQRRSRTSDRQYYSFHLIADGEPSIVGNVADAIRELQARGDGRLYTFPQHEYPGLFVNVTQQGTHETAMEIMAFTTAVSENRTEEVAKTVAAAMLRRPCGERGSLEETSSLASMVKF